MSDRPTEPEPDVIPLRPDPPELGALRAAYPGWHIHPAAFGGLRAEWKSESGLQIRVVHGTSPADLRSRLQVIEEARADSE